MQFRRKRSHATPGALFSESSVGDQSLVSLSAFFPLFVWRRGGRISRRSFGQWSEGASTRTWTSSDSAGSPSPSRLPPHQFPPSPSHTPEPATSAPHLDFPCHHLPPRAHAGDFTSRWPVLLSSAMTNQDHRGQSGPLNGTKTGTGIGFGFRIRIGNRIQFLQNAPPDCSLPIPASEANFPKEKKSTCSSSSSLNSAKGTISRTREQWS